MTRAIKPQIPNKLFFKIGEVCELAGVEALRPAVLGNRVSDSGSQKSETGHRVYRRKDVEMVLKIKNLLYDRGFTIAGARKQLAKGRPIEGPDRDKVLRRSATTPRHLDFASRKT